MHRRRVLATVIMLLLGVALPLVAGTGPAAAATTCRNVPYSPGMGWHRVCDVAQLHAPARLTGRIDWNYDSPNSRNPQSQSGVWVLTIHDQKVGGSCAYIRVRSQASPYDLADAWYPACNGTSKTYSREMNPATNGQAWTGWFRIYVCSAKDQSHCGLAWSQQIDEVGPR